MTHRMLALLTLAGLLLAPAPASAAQPGPTLAGPAGLDAGALLAAPAPLADMSASTMTVSADTVRAGDTLTYTIALRSAAEAVLDVVHPIPAHTACVAASASAGDIPYDAAARKVTWHGALGARVPVTLTVSVQVDAGTPAGTTITNTATLTETGGAPLTLQASSTVIAAANLSASTKSVSSAEALPGDVLTYTLDVVNSGNTSPLILVADPIPLHTAYVAASATNATFDEARGEVYWSGTLPPGISRRITFQASLDAPLAAGTVITNTATFNDFSQPVERQAVTTVAAAADLVSAVKTALPACVASGGLLTYTISVTNTGSIEAATCITDALPSGIEIAGAPSASPGTASYDPATAEVHWCEPLAIGEMAWVRFAAQVTLPTTATGVITNTAAIGSGPGVPLERSAATHVPLLWLDGPATMPAPGDTIDVDLNLSNVLGLQRVDALLEFPPAALDFVEVVPGNWLTPTTWDVQYDSPAGTLVLSAVLEGAPAGLDGSGTLATVRLRTLAPATASLALAATRLAAALPPQDAPIAHNAAGCTITTRETQVNGRVLLQGRSGDYAGAEVHALGAVVATTAADGSYSFASPGLGAWITVTMPGYLPAWRQLSTSGDVTLPTVTLLGGDVVGAPVVVSRDVACGGAATETIPGPPDGIIDIRDLAFLVTKFGMAATDPWWGPDACYTRYGDGDPRSFHLGYQADVNGDGRVNIQDITAAAVNYYRSAPSPWP